MALYAFDGTWNENEEGEGNDTNVAKFHEAYQEKKFYMKGVGTRLGFIGKILGGAIGAGGRIRILEATKVLKKNFDDGDTTVDIIGFSRGAALALHFANEVLEEKPDAEVRYLGLWDVVASFGLPGNDFNVGWDLTLPDNVKKCCHAMALDERRGNFEPTRVKAADGSVPSDARLEEVWFRGVHSDVGGGLSLGLSSIALCWMIEHAIACGLPVDTSALERFKAMQNPEEPISKNFDPKIDPARRIEPTDLVHVSVQSKGNVGGRLYNDPPPNLRVVG